MKKLIKIIIALAMMSSGAFALEVVSLEDNTTTAQAVVVFKNKKGVDSVFLKCIDYSTLSLSRVKKEWKSAEASLRAVEIRDIGFSLVEIDQECQTHIGRVAYAGYHMAVQNRKMCVSGQCGKVKTKTTTTKTTSVRKNRSGSTTTRKKTPLVKREVCEKGETYHPNNRKGNRCISTLGILGQGVYTGDGDGGSHGHGRGEGHGQSQGHGRGEGHGQGPA